MPGLLLALQRRVGNGAVAAMAGGRRQTVSRYVDLQPADQSPDEWPAGAPIRLANDGTMAVEQAGAKGSKRLWATLARIAESKRCSSTARGSGIRLQEDLGVLSRTSHEYGALRMPNTP